MMNVEQKFIIRPLTKDGNFFLCKRNERQGENDTWVSDIYIFDLTTKNEFKIGEAYHAQWIA